MSSELESLRAEVAELRAKLAEAEKDAERYRWIRDMWWLNTAEKRGMDDIVGFVDTPLEFDAAIDAARGKP